MSNRLPRSSAEIRREITETRSEADGLRDEAKGLDFAADELERELVSVERAEKINASADGGAYGEAVKSLLESPCLSEWERLRLQSALDNDELDASEVLGRFLAIGRGVPAAVFDQLKIKRELGRAGK